MDHQYTEYKESGDGTDPSRKRRRAKRRRGGLRLLRGTRAISLLFTFLATFIGSNIAIYAANTYFNLDTGEVVVNEIQRVTAALRATGGLIVGGGDGASPATGSILEVAGTQNVLFSTTGSTTFTGQVKMGGASGSASYGLEVGADHATNGVVAYFNGRVQGSPATQSSEFVTLSQLTGGGGGGTPISMVSTLNGLDGDLTISNGSQGIITVTPSGSTISLIIEDESITALQLADNSVVTDKINDLAVTTAKLADNAVTALKLANDAVTTDKILDAAVTNAKLATDAVATSNIQNAAVTNEKLANDGIDMVAGTGITITGLNSGRAVLGSSITITADIGGGGTGDPLLDYFKQGGNEFGATAVLGTDDEFDLNFITNDMVRMVLDTAGLATFNGNISLAGAESTITGNDRLRLASSTGNIEFFDDLNFITSGGNLTIAGNFTLSGLTITDSGTLTTISSTGGNNLELNSSGGDILIGSGNSLKTSGGYDLTSGSIVREVIPIAKYEIPVQCDTNCNGTYVSISSELGNQPGPAPAAGSTRSYRFTIRYSGGPSGTDNITWSVHSSGSPQSNFTTDGTGDIDSEVVFTSDVVALPSGNWDLRVQKAGAGVPLQISQVFLSVYDEID